MRENFLIKKKSETKKKKMLLEFHSENAVNINMRIVKNPPKARPRSGQRIPAMHTKIVKIKDKTMLAWQGHRLDR